MGDLDLDADAERAQCGIVADGSDFDTEPTSTTVLPTVPQVTVAPMSVDPVPVDPVPSVLDPLVTTITVGG